MSLIVEMTVLPCLQELKTIGTQMGYELEQQPGIWDPQSGTIKEFSLKSEEKSVDVYNKIWNGKNSEPIDKYPTMDLPIDLTKNGVLNIPNMREYGFTGKCKELTCTQKWEMYTHYLLDTFNIVDNVSANAAANSNPPAGFIFTHHNRMSSNDPMQGILPLKDKGFLRSGEFGYANNFCIRLRIHNGKVECIIIHPGFPDKGKYEEEFDFEKISGGGKYLYVTKNDNINLKLVEDGILAGMDAYIKGKFLNIKQINMDMYVIRHGNSLHNKPLSLESQAKRLDAILTPLGILQAQTLGEYLKLKGIFGQDKNKNENGPYKKIFIGCSFLQRTQMTALCVMDYAGVELNSSCKALLESMKQQAYARYMDSRPEENLFDEYDPVAVTTYIKPTSRFSFKGTTKDVKMDNEKKKELTKIIEDLEKIYRQGREGSEESAFKGNDVKNGVELTPFNPQRRNHENAVKTNQTTLGGRKTRRRKRKQKKKSRTRK